jgi:mevalonate pyrophosphate decarboxylase
MKLEDIKEKMKAWTDLYGQDLLGVDEVDKAKDINELAAILDRHENHMEAILDDARSHISHFRRDLGLR